MGHFAANRLFSRLDQPTGGCGGGPSRQFR
jgi:hypothetical protein